LAGCWWANVVDQHGFGQLRAGPGFERLRDALVDLLTVQ